MPTIKQIKAFKEVVNGGSTLSSAMRKAGYALTTSKKTEKLTATDGWQELMAKHLPDRLLAKKHKEGLDASEEIVTKDGEVIKKIDYAVRHKYLDSAYKLKGRYVKEEDDNPSQTINLIGITINNPNGSSLKLKSDS